MKGERWGLSRRPPAVQDRRTDAARPDGDPSLPEQEAGGEPRPLPRVLPGGLPVCCESGRHPSSSESRFSCVWTKQGGGLPASSLPPPPQRLLPDRSRLLRSPPCRANRGTGQRKGRAARADGAVMPASVPGVGGRGTLPEAWRCLIFLGFEEGEADSPPARPCQGFSDLLSQAAAGRTKVPQGSPGRRRRGRRCTQGRRDIARVPGLDAACGPEFDADHQPLTVSVPCGSS